MRTKRAVCIFANVMRWKKSRSIFYHIIFFFFQTIFSNCWCYHKLVCFKFSIAAVFIILYLFTKFNITPRKSEVWNSFLRKWFLRKNKVKVKYLFNVFLRRCLNNWFRLSIFNITAQKLRKKQFFFTNGLRHKNNKVNFLHDIFSTIRHSSAVRKLVQNAFIPPL